MFDKRHWFVREVHYLRLAASLVWYLILLPVTTICYLLLIKISLYSPVSWISEWLSFLFSLSSILLLFLVGCCSLLVAVYNASMFSVTPVVHQTSHSVILDVSRPSRLLHTALSALAGGFTMWCLTPAMGGRLSGLVVRCIHDEDLTCLSEHHLMLVLFGVYLGVIHSVSHFLFGENVLCFPVIKQLKFFLVKSHMLPSIFQALRSSFKHLLYFYLGYFILGCVPREWLQANLQLDYSISQLESMYSICHVSLFWSLWLSGAFLYHLWHFALFLMRIYTTEVYEFPMEATLIDQEESCLDVILSTPAPYVRHHAFQDLNDLAEHSKRRRGWIYSLSQPGGHPQRWNRVSTQCIGLLDSLTNQLLAYHDELTNGKARQKGEPTSSDGSTTEFTNTLNVGFDQSGLTTQSGLATQPVHSLSRYDSDENLGEESAFTSHTINQQSFDSGQLRRRPIHGSSDSESPTVPVSQSTCSPLVNLSRFKRFRLVKNLLEPLPDAASRALFIDCQLQLWAVQSLSALVVTSYHEDTYGVVQHSLPNILMSMLSLNSALDRHLKLLSSNKDGCPRQGLLALRSSDNIAKLRGNLHGSLKTSLHGIIATFGQHLNNIMLPLEYKKQLSQLMEYKE